MDIKGNIFVTYASQYAMENGMKGITVNYFMLDEKNRINNNLIGPTDLAQGDQSAKANALSYDDKAKFVCVPGFYEGTFVMTTGSDRKPALKLTDLKFLAPGNVYACDEEGKPMAALPSSFPTPKK